LPQELSAGMPDLLSGKMQAAEGGRLLLSQVLQDLPVALLFNGTVDEASAFSAGISAAQDAKLAPDSKDATAETEKERAGPT
jgi:hypothetical protein